MSKYYEQEQMEHALNKQKVDNIKFIIAKSWIKSTIDNFIDEKLLNENFTFTGNERSEYISYVKHIKNELDKVEIPDKL